MEYKVEKTNIVADILSRKAELAATRPQASETQVEGALLTHICEWMRQDAMMQQLKTLAEVEKSRIF